MASDLQTVIAQYRERSKDKKEYTRVEVTYVLYHPDPAIPDTRPNTLEIYVDFQGVPLEMLANDERDNIIKDAIKDQLSVWAKAKHIKIYVDRKISEETFKKFYEKRRRIIERLK